MRVTTPFHRTVSRPRSEHMDRKTATFGTFFSILFCKDTLRFQANSKPPFLCKIIIPFKKVPIIAVLLY